MGDDRLDGARTVVTLDGPAGVGKSTTAREVARRLGYRYLDSGALYRALTWALLRAGIETEAWPGLDAAALNALGVSVSVGADTLVLAFKGQVLGPELRTAEVTRHVSAVARIPAVRRWLIDHQRALGRRGRLVADGRDMGTVVFPDAATKVFLEAKLEERARRRLRDRGIEAPGAEQTVREAERLEARDHSDRTRATAPLRPAADAVVLDTTDLDFEEQVDAIIALVRRVDPDGAAATAR